MVDLSSEPWIVLVFLVTGFEMFQFLKVFRASIFSAIKHNISLLCLPSVKCCLVLFIVVALTVSGITKAFLNSCPERDE